MRARALLILVSFFALLAIAFLFLPSLSESQWQLAGEISRNTNALAVIAASIAAYIAWGTNKARAKEAKRADFKDRIHWASKHYTAEPTLESLIADHTIEYFSEDTELSSNDLALAKKLVAQKRIIEEVQQRKIDDLTDILKRKLSHLRKMLGKYSSLADLEAIEESRKKEVLTKLSLANTQMTAMALDHRLLTISGILEYIETVDNLSDLLEDIGK